MPEALYTAGPHHGVGGFCAAAEAFKEEVQAVFPDNEIVMQPLSLSIACHIGPGALAIACSKKIEA